jgi:hypothetical protein
MNIQTNKQQAFSQFDMLIAYRVTNNVLGKLENSAPKIITDYFEVEKLVELNKLKELKSKIEGFAYLQQNWDSYNADAISMIAIDVAKEILNYFHNNEFLTNGIAVHVFPMRDGGIQFEFDGENICAELEINPNGDSTFILFDDEGNIIDKGQLFELSELTTLLEEAQYA